jgi:hypothetical protein
VDGEAPGQSGRRLVEVDGLEETCAHARVETARTQRRTRGPEGHGDGAEKNKAPSCRRSLAAREHALEAEPPGRPTSWTSRCACCCRGRVRRGPGEGAAQESEEVGGGIEAGIRSGETAAWPRACWCSSERGDVEAQGYGVEHEDQRGCSGGMECWQRGVLLAPVLNEAKPS